MLLHSFFLKHTYKGALNRGNAIISDWCQWLAWHEEGRKTQWTGSVRGEQVVQVSEKENVRFRRKKLAWNGWKWNDNKSLLIIHVRVVIGRGFTFLFLLVVKNEVPWILSKPWGFLKKVTTNILDGKRLFFFFGATLFLKLHFSLSSMVQHFT